MTMNEWVEIRSTLVATEQEKFNCTNCQAKYQGRADGEEMLAKVRANMGCAEVKSHSVHKIGDEVSFSTCIGNFVKPQIYPLLRAHQMFSQGVMPYAGGLMDQPAKIIEIFGVIDSHRAEVANKERAKQAMISRGGARGK